LHAATLARLDLASQRESLAPKNASAEGATTPETLRHPGPLR